MSTTKSEHNAASTVREWLSRETPKNLQLLTKLREKLELTLQDRLDRDPNGEVRLNSAGQPLVIPGDLNDYGTPSRDWCRGFQTYSRGYQVAASEAREHYKLQIAAKAAGLADGVMGLEDEEFESELKKLAMEALRQLPEGELAAELDRRKKTAAIDINEEIS